MAPPKPPKDMDLSSVRFDPSPSADKKLAFVLFASKTSFTL
jgi:hypothetical protein